MIKMQFEPIFLSGSLAVFKFRISVRNFAGDFLAACDGKMRPNYFKNSPPNRKLQAKDSRLLLAISCLVDLARIELAPRQCE